MRPASMTSPAAGQAGGCGTAARGAVERLRQPQGHLYATLVGNIGKRLLKQTVFRRAQNAGESAIFVAQLIQPGIQLSAESFRWPESR